MFRLSVVLDPSTAREACSLTSHVVRPVPVTSIATVEKFLPYYYPTTEYCSTTVVHTVALDHTLHTPPPDFAAGGALDSSLLQGVLDRAAAALNT